MAVTVPKPNGQMCRARERGGGGGGGGAREKGTTGREEERRGWWFHQFIPGAYWRGAPSDPPYPP